MSAAANAETDNPLLGIVKEVADIARKIQQTQALVRAGALKAPDPSAIMRGYDRRLKAIERAMGTKVRSANARARNVSGAKKKR
jgi:hypothetical protein